MSQQQDNDIQVYECIREHNEQMKAACRTAIANIMRIPRHRRGPLLEGQLRYWRHANAAFLWSERIAKQKMDKSHGRFPKAI